MTEKTPGSFRAILAHKVEERTQDSLAGVLGVGGGGCGCVGVCV